MSWLILATDAFGGYGGIAQFNRDFVHALAKARGVDRIEILPRIAPDAANDLPPMATQESPVFGRIAYSWRALRRALNERPKVIFCGHVFMAVLAWALARAVGAQLVIMTHGIEVWHRLGPLTRKAIGAADLVLCASRDTRAWVLRAADIAPERVVVINNTVAEVYQPGDARALRASLNAGTAKLILSVSRLDAGQRYKGQDRIIPLLPRLAADGVEAIYLIGGVGPDRARLEALAEEHRVAEKVRFLGHVPAELLPDYYRAVDLFAMPSSGEGFGIVFLEAMTSGTPTLGLAEGGAVDALADGALGACVAAEDLYPALLKALTVSSDRQGLEHQVRQRFGRDKYDERVAQIVQRLREPHADNLTGSALVPLAAE